jgi:hypothetical protein
VLARFAGEPTIQQVQAWAVDQVDASPRQVRRWLAQSRSAAWLPDLSVDWRIRDDWDEGWGYYGPGGVDPIPGLDLSAVPEDSGRSWTRELQIGLDWELDELVTSSERIRMIGEAQDLAALRDEVTAEVTRLYFERRRLQVETLLAPPIDLGSEVRDTLRLMELTAAIDAATGGAFARALATGPHPG